MKVVVEKLGRGNKGSQTVVNGFRSNHCCKVIAQRGGGKLTPPNSVEASSGVAIATSPNFGLSRQMKRSG